MATAPATWHHGLVAAWWAEFNDDFRGHEIEYYRAAVARHGGPVLDAGCGAGRLLIPLLQDGFETDGSDISADMVAASRSKAVAAGFEPHLTVAPMHAIPARRRYRTIIVCGSFGLGSNRQRDMLALRNFHAMLEADGRLLVDLEMPYADPAHWPYWPVEGRVALPEMQQPPSGRRTAADGSEYAMATRFISVEPLEQHIVMEISVERWRDDRLEAAETHRLDVGMYFKNEMLLMLEQAGFASIELHGEHEDRPPTSDDEFVVFVANA